MRTYYMDKQRAPTLLLRRTVTDDGIINEAWAGLWLLRRDLWLPTMISIDWMVANGEVEEISEEQARAVMNATGLHTT